MNKQHYITRSYEYSKDVVRVTEKYKNAMKVSDTSADSVEASKRYRAELEALHHHYYVKPTKVKA